MNDKIRELLINIEVCRCNEQYEKGSEILRTSIKKYPNNSELLDAYSRFFKNEQVIKVPTRGGSDIAIKNLHVNVDAASNNRLNIILNNLDKRFIKENKINILWNQHSYDQPGIQSISKKGIIKDLDKIVFVSSWQYDRFRLIHKIPEEKSIVIKNAISDIDLIEKAKKIKIIYVSTPWRGLDILLDSFELLKRDDVELDIYSSTIIYGSDFYDRNEKMFKPIFIKAKNMKNVNYKGYASNQSIRKAIQNSHIFAYPCIWEETSCISAIEAAMAGCNLVTTNLGALPETLAEWPIYVNYDSNKANLIAKFSEALEFSIDNYWESSNQIKLLDQHNYFKRFWTWKTRKNDWTKLFSELGL